MKILRTTQCGHWNSVPSCLSNKTIVSYYPNFVGGVYFIICLLTNFVECSSTEEVINFFPHTLIMYLNCSFHYLSLIIFICLCIANWCIRSILVFCIKALQMGILLEYNELRHCIVIDHKFKGFDRFLLTIASQPHLWRFVFVVEVGVMPRQYAKQNFSLHSKLPIELCKCNTWDIYHRAQVYWGHQ